MIGVEMGMAYRTTFMVDCQRIQVIADSYKTMVAQSHVAGHATHTSGTY